MTVSVGLRIYAYFTHDLEIAHTMFCFGFTVLIVWHFTDGSPLVLVTYCLLTPDVVAQMCGHDACFWYMYQM